MDAALAWMRNVLTGEAAAAILLSVVRAGFILVAVRILVRITDRSVRGLRVSIVARMRRRTPGASGLELEKRAATIGGIIRRGIKVALWVIAGVMVLREFNFDVAPLLTGAGIIGLALGFGAQHLVRDVITGLLMLLENQISVNDIAIVNGTGGLVEEINLRTTVLRGLDGTIHVFPNGAITSLSNMTREFSYYVFDVGVAYKEDTDRVVSVLRDVAADLQQTDGYDASILEPLEVLGVDQLADSAVVIKARIKTMPAKQWEVGREMNRRIKRRFDEERIEIPFPHRSFHFGAASPPLKLQIDGPTREELRALVRDVLAESGR